MDSRNIEVLLAIATAKNSDRIDNKAEIANALASQNIAESMQRLQISLEDSVNKTIDSNSKLSLSNDRRSKAMNGLTLGLVFIGVLQLIWSVISS